MPYYQQSLDFNLSTSFSSHRRFYGTEHFKWKSIKRFIYIAYAFSASGINYDVFSRVCDNVRLIDFLICEFTIGMSYMFMDVFIRQYTRKIDFNSSLNPLLRGITYGVLLQSVLWSLLHSTDLADSGLFLVASLRTPPGWSRCQRIGLNITCVSTKEILNRCYIHSNITNFNNTSAHVFYQKNFKQQDNKNDFPRKIFIFGLIWFFNFLYVTVPDDIIIKMLTVTFFWRIYSTLIVLFILLISFIGSTDQILKIETKAFLTNIFDISSPSFFTDSMDHVAYAFRIGLVGVFDFGTMSPYTMIDNAVLIFTILYTLCAFARSLIVKIMYTTLTNCVKVEISVTHHYMLFAVLPLGTDFFSINRFYVFAIYLNKLLGAKASLLALTLTMSKLIHSEFRSVKNIYIIGALCFIGFSFTFTISLLTGSRMQGVMYGLNVIVLYLGGFKVAVVMWIYGVQRFSTDIQFWLGFKPTKFWRICWSFTPVVLFVSVGVRIYSLIHIRDLAKMIYAVGWIILSLLIVYIIQIRTVIRYIIRNTLASILSSSAKYGPPDSEDRKRRKSYSETLYLRHCRHNCNVVDDMVDCNHLPLRSRTRSDLSSDSFKSIYEAGPSKHSPSIAESHSSNNLS